MSENTIFVKRYEVDASVFPVNEREIWRYSGYLGINKPEDEGLNELLAEAMAEVNKVLTFKVCYRRMDISWKDDMPILPFTYNSKDLAKCIKGSSEILLFAATIGLETDRLIAKYQRLSPTKALLMQAYGAERVEKLCDVFCEEIKKLVLSEGLSVSPRYSPGYGDLPLECQKDVFSLLDCNRQIGISLNESLLMTPSKSVTALFGIGECVGINKNAVKCMSCDKLDCEYRHIKE